MKMFIPDYVKQIIEKLNRAGFEAYLVGGCVRDFVMGETPDDFDLATSALPEQVKGLFEHTADTGIAHGTITVIEETGTCEVTTFRREGEYLDSRRPSSVSFITSLEEDLRRRDFTMNAMAYHPEKGIVDPFGGVMDIERKLIRCVGNPQKRFEEDALRMLRAVRFACKLGFNLESATFRAIEENAFWIARVSAERIRDELDKAVMSPHPENLNLLSVTGLSREILPWLDECLQTPQNTPYHCFSVGSHMLEALRLAEGNRTVKWAAFLHDMGKPRCRTTDASGVDHFKGHESVSAQMALEQLKLLRFDRKTRERIATLISHHRWSGGTSRYEVKKVMSQLGQGCFEELIALMKADTLAHSEMAIPPRLKKIEEIEKTARQILQDGDPLTVADLAVCGQEIAQTGLKGPQIGKALRLLLDDVLRCPEQNQKTVLLELLKNKEIDVEEPGEG